MVSGLNSSSRNDAAAKNNVIVKTTLSLRHMLHFRGRGLNNPLSQGTAISTVCSFEEPYEGREQDPARTLVTQSGTEALYCPQQESRYLYDQGMEHHVQGKHEEATEALTQALSLSDGSDLEPHILWTLVSRHAQQDEEREAGTYLTVLKPHMAKLKDEWIEQEASLEMLSLLIEYKEWSTALRMSTFVETEDSVLARIYFETAAFQTTEKALPLLDQALELCKEQEDESLRQSILHTMVHAHAAEEEWDEALSVQESYMESLQTPLDMAQAHHDAADLHIAQGHYEEALISLEEGLLLVDDKNTALITAMLQAKAHTVYKLGGTDQALGIYKSLLTKVKHMPSEAAKIYYTMGRICCKTSRYDEALGYFRGELKVTRAGLGKYHYENSRIYHDLARIHDDALGDYEQALKYYNKALKVEQRCLKRAASAGVRNEVSAQILETQRCMGRIHYKRGEFSKAVTVSFADDVSDI